MTHSVSYCSELSRAQSEEIYGTAARIDTWLLLEHPPAWSAKSFPDDRLPADIQKRLNLLAELTPRCRRLLIRQRHQRGEELHCFLISSREQNERIFRITANSYEDLLSFGPASLDRHPGAAPWTEPLYLVCTHGRHDKCCAKFGFSTYRAVRKLTQANAWECSHVGGDRFAANLICLPHGIYYGNVFPEDAEALVTAYKQGKIALKHYRGRSCYSRTAQIGEYFIRSESGLLGLDDFSFLGSAVLEENVWQVQFLSCLTAEIHEVEFRTRDLEFSEYLTCNAVSPKPVAQYELSAYRVR
ncbi:MAG TPA: sucrase ferredoxin [Bryobacteraceae bacterium]|nr:sucrase ferredoxin [Bryobacteraceae bacterium]